MPNIIINNYCNQKCKYCFAEDNMSSLIKNDMNILTFIKVLKYLKFNNDNNVRILGGEPLLSKNIRKFISLSLKGGFDIIIFSNINIPNEKIKNIFDGLSIKGNFRINCNINNPDFYKEEELKNIDINLKYLKNLGIKLILGYNIYELNKKADFIFELAKKHNTGAVNLKITNSSIGEKLIIDNSKKELGTYLFNLINKYSENFFIDFSCGLDRKIFTNDELKYINDSKIKLAFGCEGNIGKFDINSDGTIFKCFPLQSLYTKNMQNIDYLLNNKISIQQNLVHLTNDFGNVLSNGECIANKKIKSI